jgi:hypothetical protein
MTAEVAQVCRADSCQLRDLMMTRAELPVRSLSVSSGGWMARGAASRRQREGHDEQGTPSAYRLG